MLRDDVTKNVREMSQPQGGGGPWGGRVNKIEEKNSHTFLEESSNTQ